MREPSATTILHLSIILGLFLVLFIIILSPVSAQSLPVDYRYTITPSDDIPSTPVVDVRPGGGITVAADATMTYKGVLPVYAPGFTVVTDLLLADGGKTIASRHSEQKVEGMVLKPGQTVTKHGESKLLVPAGTPPGQYTLTASAYADLPVVGRKGDTRSFVVRVYVDATPAPSVSPTPSPTASPGAGSPTPDANSTGNKHGTLPTNAPARADTPAIVEPSTAGTRTNTTLPGTNSRAAGNVSPGDEKAVAAASASGEALNDLNSYMAMLTSNPPYGFLLLVLIAQVMASILLVYLKTKK